MTEIKHTLQKAMDFCENSGREITAWLFSFWQIVAMLENSIPQAPPIILLKSSENSDWCQLPESVRMQCYMYKALKIFKVR